MSLRWSLACALLVGGCVAGADSTGTTTQSVVVHNKIASNKLASNKLASNKLASNKLASNKLASNKLQLDAQGSSGLINTDDGREVLTYMISCAVPSGITLVGTDSNGTQWEFFGEIGLAPSWIDSALDRTGQHWVSACLFARVNGFNVSVPVSMRGPSDALTTTPDELANWTIQEGAFYGNLFTPAAQPINWIACSGRDNAQAVLAQRECATPDPATPGKTLCGFNYAGTCGSYVAHATPMACRAFSANGYYVDCAAQPMFTRHHGDHDASGPRGRDEGDEGEAEGDDHGDGGDDGEGGGDCNDNTVVFRQVITTFIHP